MTHSRSLLAVLASALTALLTTLLLTLGAPPALAHAGLISSNPEDGAVLDALPSEIVLEFTEEIGTPAFVVVTDPDGKALQDGDPAIDGATVRQSIDPATRSGLHTIAYRVVSADGHPVQGHVRVRVDFPVDKDLPGSTAPDGDTTGDSAVVGADGTEEAAATDTTDGAEDGPGTASRIAGGVALILALLLGVLALTRRSRP